MLRQVTMFVLTAVFFAVPALAQEPDAPASLAGDDQAQSDASNADDGSLVEKASYIFGYRMITQMKSQGVELDIDNVLKGMQVAMAGGELGISDEEALSVMQAYEIKARANKAAQLKALAATNLEKEAAFFQENATKENVEKLENGVQYEILKSGPEDGESPTAEDRVKVHYKGMFTNGQEFDASGSDGPAEFAVSGVIRGFTSALTHMKIGDKWKVYIPSELGYGPNGAPRGGIGPNETLIFEIELVEIKKKDSSGG